MASRVILVIALIFSVIFEPFWLSAILMLLGIAYFPIFWEGILVFLVGDFLYGVERAELWGITFFMTLLAAVSVAIGEFLKKKLKFYPNR